MLNYLLVVCYLKKPSHIKLYVYSKFKKKIIANPKHNCLNKFTFLNWVKIFQSIHKYFKKVSEICQHKSFTKNQVYIFSLHFALQRFNGKSSTLYVFIIQYLLECKNSKVCSLLPSGEALVFETFLKWGNLQCKFNFNRNEVLVLMIENIETIRIVLYLPRGYMMEL